MTTRFGRKVLRTECEKVMNAPEGQRNITLNMTAFMIGGLVAGGEIDEDEAREELTRAGLESGLLSREVHSTVRSGLVAGGKFPWTGRVMERRGGPGVRLVNSFFREPDVLREVVARQREAAERWYAANPDYPETLMARAGATSRCRPCHDNGVECFHEHDEVLVSWVASYRAF